MDTFAALALATEPPGKEILHRAPQGLNAPIVTNVMWRNIIGHSVFQILVLIVMVFFGPVRNWLVFDYHSHCTKPGLRHGACLLYNPFYTDSLYYTEKGIEAWKQKQYVYDPALLDAMGQAPEVGEPT